MALSFGSGEPGPRGFVLSRDISQPSASHISSHIHGVAVGAGIASTAGKIITWAPGGRRHVVFPYLPFSFRSSYGAENA